MPDYRLICADLDGTLLDSNKNITPEDRYWIRKVVEEKGVKFAIASGRMHESAVSYLGMIGIEGPAVCLNGACIYDEAGNLVDQTTIETQLAKSLADVFRSEGKNLLMFSDRKWFVNNRECFGYYVKRAIYKNDPVLVDDCGTLLNSIRVNKLLTMDKDHDSLQTFMDKLISMGFTSDVVSYYLGKAHLEIMPKGVDKGYGITRLAKACGFDMSQVIAFGDDYNDVQMLETAGLGIAMKNSFPGVAEHAKMVTEATNNEGGIARTIQKLFY